MTTAVWRCEPRSYERWEEEGGRPVAEVEAQFCRAPSIGVFVGKPVNNIAASEGVVPSSYGRCSKNLRLETGNASQRRIFDTGKSNAKMRTKIVSRK